MRYKKIQLGFTLVELLVTITILVILSSVGLVTYSKSQLSARDSRRKNDLRSIQVALELYYQNNPTYPTTNADSTSGSSSWISGLFPQYINLMPRDPLKDLDPTSINGNTGYAYKYIPSCTAGGPGYVLIAGLENSVDPEINYTQKGCDGITGASNTSAYIMLSP